MIKDILLVSKAGYFKFRNSYKLPFESILKINSTIGRLYILENCNNLANHPYIKNQVHYLHKCLNFLIHQIILTIPDYSQM